MCYHTLFLKFCFVNLQLCNVCTIKIKLNLKEKFFKILKTGQLIER